MIFGLTVTVGAMMIGGATLFILVLLQVLLGMRVIKLGRRHRAVHKWMGFLILGVAAIHGLLGILFGFSLNLF